MKKQDWSEKGIRLSLVHGTLCSLLKVINGLEGLERWQMVERIRDLFWDFKNFVGGLREFQDNEQLATLDEEFLRAGWDDQGFRWTKEDGDSIEDIFVVEFTNKEHTEWRLA